MRLLYVYQTLARYGGVERVLADKMNYLASHYGYEIYILTRDQGAHQIPFPLVDGVHYDDLGIRLHTQYAYKGIRRLWEKVKLQCLYENRISKKIREIQPDYIIGTDVMPARSLLRHKGKAKLLIESHTMYNIIYSKPTFNPIKKILYKLALRAYRKADLLITLTEGDAYDWRKKNHNCNIRIIPNVVNLNQTNRYSCQTSKRVIFVGRFSKQKGIPYLLEIWKKVQEIHSDWSLEFYGDGEEKDKYAPLMSRLNVNIHKPTSHIHEEYCKSSIFVLTSLCESFGLVIPEAMSCGLPVVSFDCPYGPRDIISDGKDGFLIPQFDIDLFVEKVIFLIDNEEVRKKMGRTAIKSSQRYAADIIMPKWKKLFEDFLN